MSVHDLYTTWLASDSYTTWLKLTDSDVESRSLEEFVGISGLTVEQTQAALMALVSIGAYEDLGDGRYRAVPPRDWLGEDLVRHLLAADTARKHWWGVAT